MKRLLRKLGMSLLRMSGMDISDEVIDNVLVPVVLKHEFELAEEDVGKYAARKIRDGEVRLAKEIRPYIHIEHTRTETSYKVRMYLIIQRFHRKNISG